MQSLHVLLIICASVAICVRRGPMPIYGAKEIEEILSRHINHDGSLSSFVKGTKSNDTDGINYADYNLDVNVLDLSTFRKFISLAKNKYKRDYRRSLRKKIKAYKTGGFKTHPRLAIYDRGNVSHFQIALNKIYDLMLQSIYATKERIADTKRVRSIFKLTPGYKLALMYASCVHAVNKMESLFAQARHFIEQTYFLYYLIIYEKMLQCNIDVEYAVTRMFSTDMAIITKEEMPVPEQPADLPGGWFSWVYKKYLPTESKAPNSQEREAMKGAFLNSKQQGKGGPISSKYNPQYKPKL